MSELALELLNQLSKKVKSENSRTSEIAKTSDNKQTSDKKAEREHLKSLPDPHYTKIQIKKIEKYEAEVAELVCKIKNLGKYEVMIDTYDSIMEMPRFVRYMISGSSIKRHPGYSHFIYTMKKLLLNDKLTIARTKEKPKRV
jgi:hypothetical protein